MRNTITLNGIESSTIPGLLIQSLPPISKPLMRTETEEIDGRDGDIITNLGFSAYDKQISVGLYGDFDINQVIAYFNSEGTVIFSNEPEQYYNYQIISQIDFERLVRYRTATVTLHCQPFKYSVTEGADILSASDNFATLNQSLNTDSSFYTYTSNVQDNVTATRINSGTGGKFFAVYTIPVVQGITYHFSGSAAARVTMYGYTNTLRGTSAGINAASFTSGFTYTATFTGTMVLGFYAGLNPPDVFIRNFFVTNEAGATVSGEGTFLTLENTSDAPFSKLTPKGDTFQQTYSGKNLMPTLNTERTLAGVTFTPNPDGSITLNGTSTEATSYPISVDSATVTRTVRLEAGTYTLNGNYDDGYFTQIMYMPIGGSGNTYARATFTLTEPVMACEYLRVRAAGYTFNNLRYYPQLEKGSTITDYEPYVGGTPSPNPDYPQDIQVVTGEQSIKICGKNLAQLVNTEQTINGVTFTPNADGSVTMNGTSTAAISYPVTNTGTSVTRSFQLGAGTYTANGDEHFGDGYFTQVMYKYADSAQNVYAANTFTLTDFAMAGVYIRVRTAGVTFNDYRYYPQLELGEQESSFEPYQEQTFPISLGSTELCKIGDYQDYIWRDGDTWKVHKDIGKVVLDGTESWDSASGTGGIVFFCASITDYKRSDNIPMSNYFIGETNIGGAGSVHEGHIAFATEIITSNRFYVKYNNFFASLSDFTTWLSTHNATVYYALATPTDTAITGETLIGQLEALNAAHAYKGRTHIISTAGSDANLPHIIEAEVAGSCDGTVTNSGNTTARPKLTIFGSGNISIFLNGVQLFQVALGTEGHITIDTAAMEAYQDTTDNLKNRLVTGEYNNFVLNPGDNEISFSGSVTMCVVENYSRWL